jgi:hypothetical protein
MMGLPAKDWARPYGIPFDRGRCPVDDEVTDLAAWLAGQFDSLTATTFELGDEVTG